MKNADLFARREFFCVLAIIGFALLPFGLKGQTSNPALLTDSAGAVFIGGAHPAFVSKRSGASEVWRVNLGSGPQDQVLALARSTNGDVYAGGIALGTGFLVKLNAAGERTAQIRLAGAIRSVAVDQGGHVYAGGLGFLHKFDSALQAVFEKEIAGGVDGLAVDQDGALHAAIARPDGQGVAAKLTAEGEYEYQIELGPSVPAAILLDSRGSAYVTGTTSSLDFRVVEAAQARRNGPSDAFVTKISRNGVEWSSYLGGRGDDTGTALGFDPAGNLLVAGFTTSSDFPGSESAEPWHGSEDGFLAVLDPNGAVVESTYHGTPGQDRVLAAAVDQGGNVLLGGWSKEQSQRPLLTTTRLNSPGTGGYNTLRVLRPKAAFFVSSLSDSGSGSLRDLVSSSPAGSTINFSVTGTIHLLSRILINKNLTITGPGSSSLVIDGGGTTRLFFIQSGTVAISGLTLANGYGKGGSSNAQTPGGGAAGMGGAIFQNGGSLTLTSVVFQGNKAVGGDSNSIFIGNNSGGGGGFGGDAPTGLDVQPGGSGGDLGGTGGSPNGGGTAGAGAGGGGGQNGNPGGNGGFGGGGGGSNCGQAGNGGFGGGGGTACNTGLGKPGFGGGTPSAILFSGAGGGAGFGGAIFVRAGSATIDQSTFQGNQAIGGQSTGGVPGDPGQGKGGAVFIFQGATVSITNSTFSGSVAAQAGVNSVTGYDGTTGGAKLCPGQDTVEICGTATQSGNSIQTFSVTSGDNQTGATTRTFPIPLAVRVTTGGTPISGVAVTFTVRPNGGASGTLIGGTTTLVVNTDANGYASAQLTANATPGSFTVTALDKTFHLTTTQCVNSPQVSVATDSLVSPAINSLRWAVNNACAGQTITFAPAVTSVTLTPDPANGRLRIDDSLTITGNGAAQTTISGGASTRLFFIQRGNVAISNLTLANGYGKGGSSNAQTPGGGAAGMGGAIFQNGGSLTLTSVVLQGNKAVGGDSNSVSPGNNSGGGGGFGGDAPTGMDVQPGGSGGDLGGTGGSPNGGGTAGAGAGGGGGRNGIPGGNGGFGGGGGGSNCGQTGNGGFGGGGGTACTTDLGKPGFGGGTPSAFLFSGAGGGAGFGGAIFVRAGSATIDQSTFQGNQAIGGQSTGGTPGDPGQGKGGAVFIFQGATVSITNSTFSGNVAAGAGVNSVTGYDGTPGGAKLCPGQDNVNLCGTVPLAAVTPANTGTAGIAYESGLVLGGTGAYSFSISTGALPDGLTFNGTTGAIAGTPTKSGVFTFTGTVHDSTSSVSVNGTITIVAGTPAKLVFSNIPGAFVGTAIAPFTVSVADTYGNVVTENSGLVITLSVTGSTFSGAPPAVATAAGVAAFNNVILGSPGTGVTLTASATGPLTGTSNSFNVLGADLTVSKTHAGTFSQGQSGAQYKLTVRNLGPGPAAGQVQVVDTLPVGLTATSIAGTGWTCVLNTLTCTRSDALALNINYPDVTVTVDVSATAAASLTNQATVSGGGETNLSNDTATDVTSINPIVVVPAGQLSVTQTGFGRNRSTGLWSGTMTVTNTGSTTVAGPIQAVLSDLTPGVTMANNTGFRNGNPYITVTNGALAPGASVSVIIQFMNPNNVFINFTAVGVSGTF